MATTEFSKFAGILSVVLSQHHLLRFKIAQLELRHSEVLRGLKQSLCAPGPRDPTETETKLYLSVSCRAMGQQCPDAGEGLWVQQTWLWHKPSWRRSPLTSPQSHQHLTRTGKQTLGGHKQNIVHTRTQEKGAVTPQETCPGVSKSLWQSRGSVVGC